MQRTPFLGEERTELIRQINAIFVAADQQKQARWVSLEAQTGTGKTRLVQEFYSELAIKQHSPYWPAELQGVDSNDLNVRRKALVPILEHTKDTSPEWVWFAIKCGTRGGEPIDALAQDLRVLQAHEQHFLDAIRASKNVVQRATNDVAQGIRQVAKGSASDTGLEVMSAATTQSSFEIGFLIRAAQAVHAQVNEARDRSKRRSSSVIDLPPKDAFVNTISSTLSTIGQTIPVIVVVEDVHNADAALLKLLESLISQDSKILILTSGIPKFISDNDRLNEILLDRAGTRVFRTPNDRPSALQTSGPLSAIRELPPQSRKQLIRHLLPEATRATIERISERYKTPLSLELFCSLPEVIAAAKFDDEIIERIKATPRGLVNLYRAHWSHFPESQQTAMMYAALIIPSTLSNDKIDVHTWRRQILIEALSHLNTIRTASALESLNDEKKSASWVQSEGGGIVSFTEFEHLIVAREESNALTKAERDSFMRAALQSVATRKPSAEKDLASAWVGVALSLRVGNASKKDNARFALEILSHHEDTIQYLDARIFIARKTMGRLKAGRLSRDISLQLASCYIEAEDLKSARDIYKKLLKQLSRTKRASPKYVLQLRTLDSKAIVQFGDEEEGLRRLITIKREQRAARSSREDRAETQFWIAFALRRLGRFTEAVKEGAKATKMHERVFGTTDVRTLIAQGNLAGSYADIGITSKAVAIFDDVLRRAEGNVSVESEHVLVWRLRIAQCTQNQRRFSQALGLHRATIQDMEDSLGDMHTRTLEARSSYALCLQEAAKHSGSFTMFHQSLDEYRTLELDEVSRYSEKSEKVIITKANLANAMADLAEFCAKKNDFALASESYSSALELYDRALQALQHFSPTQDRMLLQVRAARTLAEGELSALLRKDVLVEQAIDELKTLATTQSEEFGPAHMDPLSTSGAIAKLWGRIKRWEHAVAAWREVCSLRASIPGGNEVALANNRIDLLISEGHLGISGSRKSLEALVEQLVDSEGVEHPTAARARRMLDALANGNVDDLDAHLRP